MIFPCIIELKKSCRYQTVLGKFVVVYVHARFFQYFQVFKVKKP